MLASRSPSDKTQPTPAAANESEPEPAASRTTSTATTGTAGSSVTFAEDSNINHGQKSVGSGRQPPSREYASFASDTSFVVDHNDSSVYHIEGGCVHPMEKARQHFASHQTSNERSDSAIVGNNQPHNKPPLIPLPPGRDCQTKPRNAGEIEHPPNLQTGEPPTDRAAISEGGLRLRRRGRGKVRHWPIGGRGPVF